MVIATHLVPVVVSQNQSSLVLGYGVFDLGLCVHLDDGVPAFALYTVTGNVQLHPFQALLRVHLPASRLVGLKATKLSVEWVVAVGLDGRASGLRDDNSVHSRIELAVPATLRPGWSIEGAIHDPYV
jgi:hypothetical protein